MCPLACCFGYSSLQFILIRSGHQKTVAAALEYFCLASMSLLSTRPPQEPRSQNSCRARSLGIVARKLSDFATSLVVGSQNWASFVQQYSESPTGTVLVTGCRAFAHSSSSVARDQSKYHSSRAIECFYRKLRLAYAMLKIGDRVPYSPRTR